MIRVPSSFRFVALTFLGVSLLISGCSGGGKGKPTKANYDNIKNDMTAKEVEEHMGAATGTVDPAKMAGDMMKGFPGGGGIELPGGIKVTAPVIKYWEEGDTAYIVTFMNDKVVTKATGKASDVKK
jgi:hypothetical protein